MHRILVASRSFGRGAARTELEELFGRHGAVADFSPLQEAASRLHVFEGMIVGSERADAQLFSRATRLKAIIKYGVGTDNIDLRSAARHGVQVLNLPGVNSETVAEMALGLMLAVARRIAEGDRLLRSGHADRPVGLPVCGKVLGVVGTGTIGCALVRLVQGLRMRVLAWDLQEREEVLALGGSYVTLEQLLGEADFVSVHLPLTESTFHRLGAAELALMRPTAFLINTARGAVVDEAALLEALANGRLAGAGLDVLEFKPASASPLLELANVVCTPHIGAYTGETLRRMDADCVSTLCAALDAARHSIP
jgi:phosphoglycerate dehydrogenase-like enzyme